MAAYQDSDPKALIVSLDNLHTTELGVSRIRKNLSLWDTEDVVGWCREKSRRRGAKFEEKGKIGTFSQMAAKSRSTRIAIPLSRRTK